MDHFATLVMAVLGIFALIIIVETKQAAIATAPIEHQVQHTHQTGSYIE